MGVAIASPRRQWQVRTLGMTIGRGARHHGLCDGLCSHGHLSSRTKALDLTGGSAGMTVRSAHSPPLPRPGPRYTASARLGNPAASTRTGDAMNAVTTRAVPGQEHWTQSNGKKLFMAEKRS